MSATLLRQRWSARSGRDGQGPFRSWWRSRGPIAGSRVRSVARNPRPCSPAFARSWPRA